MMNKLEKLSEKMNPKEIDKAHMEINAIEFACENKESNKRESVLNKLHSNQEAVKNNEQKGEERIAKKDEIQK